MPVFLWPLVLGLVLAACSLGGSERRRAPASEQSVAALAQSPQPAGIAKRVAYRRFEVTERLAAELPLPNTFASERARTQRWTPGQRH